MNMKTIKDYILSLQADGLFSIFYKKNTLKMIPQLKKYLNQVRLNNEY